MNVFLVSYGVFN